MAARVLLQAAEGKDPVAEQKADRGAGALFKNWPSSTSSNTPRRKIRAWEQADKLVQPLPDPEVGQASGDGDHPRRRQGNDGKHQAPILANQVMAAASAIFAWGIKEEIVTLIHAIWSRRMRPRAARACWLTAKIPIFWKAFDDAGLLASTALKLILLTGQRPGEVRAMHREHIVDGWWHLPGAPDPCPRLARHKKRSMSHRVWLSKPAQELARRDRRRWVDIRPSRASTKPCERSCASLKCERATPHDLRRTNGTVITRLGFGRRRDEPDSKSQGRRHRLRL